MCIFSCCECSKQCCKSIPIKRYFLPLLAVFSLTAFEQFRDFIYLPLVVGAGFFILFWNYPWIVYYTASKPLYYEDLFIDEKKLPNYAISKNIRSKFQCILDWVLIITNTLLSAALADYWLYRINVEGYIEIIGVTGGIIKIFQMVNNTISRIMLKILKRYIQKENIRFRQEQRERISQIIKLKRVQSGVWKIFNDNESGVELTSRTNITGRESPSNFIIGPTRDRLNTI